ncbi:helix-turn-helix domain-containing protein [Flavobacterium sp. 17A]|uniref:Helix-turn-helix domain-containing protein n=1 Tax=Flavobacterium potami TaxID=2872310 RepID=A0A9X1HEF2_9FLAO|nr:helix-turn-helix domain-containing protein [Flavobacterium potami]MBZ4037803.1 helix-turn-helix domain-containing protein [Flavobacterium potami]
MSKVNKDTNAENNQQQQQEHFLKVGERIRELRLLHGWSIKGYEAMLSLPSGTLHNIEHGKGGTGINFLTIINHLTGLGYSYKWLLDFDNDDHFKKDEQHIYLDIDKNELIEINEEMKDVINKFTKVVSKYK